MSLVFAGLQPRGRAPCCGRGAVSSVPDLDALISSASRTGRLDLSDSGLTEIPHEVLSLTELVDLSLAGNDIAHLPDDICKLKSLERLAVPGNRLQALPEGLGELRQLRGLWLQGNLLESLPTQLGDLHELQTISVAGNQLRTLPANLTCRNLRYFSAAGNGLTELPSALGALTSLRVLALYGNFLNHVPDAIGNLSSLEELWLQGNCLEHLPASLEKLVSLKQLCASDNRLTSLPASLGELQALDVLSVYGNNIRELPHSLERMEQLRYIWLEGNPFDVQSLNSTFLPGNLKCLGLSETTTADQPRGSWQRLSVSRIAGTGNAGHLGGYFKLERYSEDENAPVIVVAFGSAPAVPNWGGVLSKIKTQMQASNLIPAYDVLYVVDSWRSWYTQQKEEAAPDAHPGSYYREELVAALKSYKRIVMLGDSMGASGALLFSDLATSVVAFCPQVDLMTSVMRPGKGALWCQAYKKELLRSVSNSRAGISVHCGNFWQDCAQVNLLPKDKVAIRIHNDVDNHRLTKYLNADERLVSLIKDEIQNELSHVEI